MSGLDAATASAVAALIVAIVALFVAIAQATQQYLITGQLIRLCDSVVFGPMPGQGRRVWQFSQFRFRVIYSIPQISIDTDLWPSGGLHMKSHAIGELELPPLADPDSDNETDANSVSLSMALRARELFGKRSWRNVLNWFRRKGEQQSDSDSMDDLSGREVSIMSEKKRFRLPISLPAGLRLRRRRPSPASTATSSYQSSIVTINQNPTSRLRQRGGAIKRLTDSTDSLQSASRRRPPQVGEASWVSFCRAIEIPCRRSVRIDLVEYDADRCPSDLISVPMQVSMRDIVIMALMAGMELTNASFPDKSISMQGAVGTLTSSNHAILGPILHFTPRNVEDSLPMMFGARIREVNGKISRYWMARTWDTCSVAGSFYHSVRRRTVRRLDDRWMRDSEGVESYDIEAYSDPKKSSKKKAKAKEAAEKTGSSEDKARSAQVAIRPHNGNFIPDRRMQDGHWIILPPMISMPRPIIIIRANEKRSTVPESSDKDPTTSASTEVPKKENPVAKDNDSQGTNREEITTMGRNNQKEPGQPSRLYNTETHKLMLGTHASFPPPGPPPGPPPPPPGPYISYLTPRRRATVEDAPDEEGTTIHAGPAVDISPLLERIGDDGDEERHERPSTPPSDRARLAKERQDARAEKLRQIQEDKIAVDKVMKRGAMGSPYEEAAGMLGHSGKGGPLLLTNYPHFPEKEVPGGPGPTAEEEAAHEREKMRERDRRERDQARDDRNRARNRAVDLTKVDMFWLCQIDVMPGSWATPWESHLPISSALDGAVTVILEALLGFLDEGTSLCYTDSRPRVRYYYQRTANWMLQGGCTCPAYGQNARGGVIATGTYTGVRVPCFESVIPALELLYSYEWQVDSNEHDGAENREAQNVELMRLDSWLSYVGRVPEVAEGPHDLLRQTPALVQLLMEDFEIDFQNIDLSAREGGLQDIQGLAENVMDFLTDEELTQPEQLYVLVAFLRGVKAAQCIIAGSDTTDLRDILLKDVQAHLV
ncbi:hypothetical protein GGS24DRAFT_21522 [Hypoxylon argillaceum]|nr:hypothetical protein GGS24DRAFT_21522 [Hypoxylon argillaceum]